MEGCKNLSGPSRYTAPVFCRFAQNSSVCSCYAAQRERPSSIPSLFSLANLSGRNALRSWRLVSMGGLFFFPQLRVAKVDFNALWRKANNCIKSFAALTRTAQKRGRLCRR